MEKNNEVRPEEGGVKNKFVETYADDMAKALEDSQNGGLIKNIIHSEEQHEKEKKRLSPESVKNKYFLFLGLGLIFTAFTVWYFFVFISESISIPKEQLSFSPLIFTDASSSIEVAGLTKDQIMTTLLDKIERTKVKIGGVEGVYLLKDQKNIGLRELVKMLEWNFIPTSNTFLVSDSFLMGVVNNEGVTATLSVATGKNFFILLKMRSTADIFNSLKVWEDKIFLDLHELSGIEIDADTKYLSVKEFEDGIVENKNARILYDNDNKIVMMYVFADDNSIVITNTETAAREIMRRLATSQIKK